MMRIVSLLRYRSQIGPSSNRRVVMLLSLLVLLCWRSPDPGSFDPKHHQNQNDARNGVRGAVGIGMVTGFHTATLYTRKKQVTIAVDSLPHCVSLPSKSMIMSSLWSSSSNHDQSSSSSRKKNDARLDPKLRHQCAAIRVIASDVDGTILGGPTPHSRGGSLRH